MKNIFEKFLIIFIIFSLIFSINSVSCADNESEDNNSFKYDNEIMPINDEDSKQLYNNHSQEKNYFYAGSNDINLDNNVKGDVFICTSGTVNINSNIDGNAFICASSVNILDSANIQGSLFNASRFLLIKGSVNTNVYNVSNTLELKGTIGLDLFSTSNESVINGSIYRNANISAENISLSESAVINGDLNYSSKDQINISDNIVNGNIYYEEISINENKNEISYEIKSWIISTISFIILAIVIFVISKWLNCKFLNSYSNFINTLPKYLLFGLIGLIVTPITCILLLICGVTFSLAFILALLYLIAMLIASSSVIIILSKMLSGKILSKYNKINNTLLTIILIAILSIVYKLLQLIPTFGTIITLSFILVGLGILIINICPTTKSKEQN